MTKNFIYYLVSSNETVNLKTEIELTFPELLKLAKQEKTFDPKDYVIYSSEKLKESRQERKHNSIKRKEKRMNRQKDFALPFNPFDVEWFPKDFKSPGYLNQ